MTPNFEYVKPEYTSPQLVQHVEISKVSPDTDWQEIIGMFIARAMLIFGVYGPAVMFLTALVQSRWEFDVSLGYWQSVWLVLTATLAVGAFYPVYPLSSHLRKAKAGLKWFRGLGYN